jgi:RNA polymerase sigma factor (sigma-70 family)
MKTAGNPLADDPLTEPEDLRLVRAAQAGSRDALERLVERHQPWIYNVTLRMLYYPDRAEDATQEILVKVLTKLSTFEGRSSVRTWLYRIAINHILNIRRDRLEPQHLTFASYAQALDGIADQDFPDPAAVPADAQLLLQEAKIGCTSGLLLCLDAEQRLVYILGEIFGVGDAVGSELLATTRANFRQKLVRARRDLHNFMHNECGLVNEANPCRCARKTQGFIKAGYLDPNKLLFASHRLAAVREVAPKAIEGLEALDVQYAEIHRNHPFYEPPDLARSIRRLFERPEVRSLLELK